MRLALVLALLAAPVAAHSPLFDGSAPPSPLVLPAARTVPPHETEIMREPEAIPAELVAARARVGVDAQLARLSSRPAGETFTFAVIGDAERGRFWWERIFSPGKFAFVEQWRAAQAGPADFVLQLGDFVSEGDAEHYAEGVALLDAELRKPFLISVGNHDRSRPNGDADKRFYEAVFGPRDYFFDHGGWRFVALDTSDRKLTAAQLVWLAQVLSAPGPKVIYTHVPPAYIKKEKPLPEVGALEEFSVNAEEAEAQKGYLSDFVTNYFKDGDEEFERLVLAGGVKAVYMGHIHAFWAANRGGVRYVISGGGGSPLYPLPPGFPKKKFAHILQVQAGPAGLVETVVPWKGTPFVLPPVR